MSAPLPARWWVLLLAVAPGSVLGAEAFAVLPIADPPGPDAALVDLAGEVRAGLAEAGAGVLGPEALRERLTGSAPAAALAASDTAYQAALELHARGDFEGSIRTLRAGIADLELLPRSPEVHARLRRAMLRLARSEQALGRRVGAVAVLQRLLQAEPALEVDARLYPPGFQRLVDEVRNELEALATRRLTVVAQAGVRVSVEGRDLGPAPATVELPPGTYRVAGSLGAIRSREVVVDLSTQDRRVELDLSAAELLRLDGGPGLSVPREGRAVRVRAAARLLDLDRLAVVRVGAEGPRSFLGAALVDVRLGTSSSEGRVWLDDGKLPAGAAAALAAHLLRGEASPLVQVAPAPDLEPRLPPLVEPRRGLLTWDGVKRPGARPIGWTALGLGATSIVLTVIAVDRAGAADQAYARARGMLAADGQGVKLGYTVAGYNGTIRKGDRARADATAAALGAGAAALGAVITGFVSYRQTGEIGPIRF